MLRLAHFKYSDRRLILIAPASVGPTTVPAAVKDKKVLLFWAEKDPVISEQRADLVASSFDDVSISQRKGFTVARRTDLRAVIRKKQLVFQVARYTFEGIEAHIPEKLAPERFHEQISKFLSQ